MDLADSDDEDCQFHSLQDPVTTAFAGCPPRRVPACRMECQRADSSVSYIHSHCPVFPISTAVLIFFSFWVIGH